jgi:hypothetical protein
MKHAFYVLAPITLLPEYFLVSAFNPRIHPASITRACRPTSTPDSLSFEEDLRKRQVTDAVTCGFVNGVSSEPRTAQPGFDCRVDTKNALWGFCPTTVIAATDCGLAGMCQDSYFCSSGCGILDEPTITTIHW